MKSGQRAIASGGAVSDAQSTLSPPNALSAPRPGFRLDRLEVYNWGTLDGSVWALDCRGENALLTGDIGSGKSTLVDAISTLLIAPQKITYNRAAGAEARERTLRTYVLGHYKSERGGSGSAARPIALRDHNKYSVILGRFTNEQLGQQVTLAEVFWWRDTQGQPARFYVVADLALTITAHFSGFGKNIDRLRKRLREMDGVELHDSFPPYGAAYRRRLGIESEQAMDLFYQTVSMKAVGNLTEFVRAHMLEPFDVEERIQALIGHFDDLTRAHEAVQKAKAQIELLAPLVESCERHGSLVEQVESLKGSRDALTPWFAMLKGELLDERIAKLQADALRMDERLAALATKISDGSAKCASLEAAIEREGGARIAELQREIAARAEERDRRVSKAERYRDLARAAELPTALDAETFIANGSAIAGRREETGMAQATVQNAITDAAVEMRELNEQHGALVAELESLRRRRSNIPAHMLRIRELLCAALGLEDGAAPFAGELIQVREDAREWEGAIERLLHGFGLSLLVDDAHYARVAEWVDHNNLKGRLVYYRTAGGAQRGRSRVDPRSVADKLQIEPSSPFYGWLDDTIRRRFDHLCCATIDELRRAPRGITRAGQIKEGSERHEKDDRHAIGDRTRWVLGWSNERKIAALEKQAADVALRGDAALGRLTGLRDEQRAIDERKATLDRLSMFESFREIDWKSVAVDIDDLERELHQLEATSDRLHTLREQLRVAGEALGRLKEDRETRLDKRGALRATLEAARGERANCTDTLAATSEERRAEYFPRLETLCEEATGGASFTVESCEVRQREMRSWIQNRIDADEARRRHLGERIASDMQRYIAAYPLETREVDAALESAGEFGVMLDRLRSDDLPRFEEKFKELLNKNTIREIANFQSQLRRERETIIERIGRINQSLNEIDYNPGRFILLEAELSTDREVRDFQQELRACTEGALTGSEDDAYSETKFAQVKRIIDRFRGREGSAEIDRRWTRTVTDVRNWYIFSASERWREDGSEYEHYTDSGGKSGGQKEKLAYTVLAASLAYQFGLDAVAGKARTFRFVVIDEAFGRGSDESARYGLELFRKLELQLLVVTPLQKIHIIEPYVSAVGFVYNPDGNASMLRNLTIEEYREQRAAASANPAADGRPAVSAADVRGNGAK
jgi:uncharacterized protein YPO0396